MVEAIRLLRDRGLAVELELIGGGMGQLKINWRSQ